jgi:hypothetical protein
VERVFTLDEALLLLPELTTLLTELRAAHGELLARVPPQGEHLSTGNGSPAAASALSAVERRYVSLLQRIESMGAVVRDAQTGLVDFAATREGAPVYLCWRLGEPTIGFWHPRDTGIAGRQPL